MRDLKSVDTKTKEKKLIAEFMGLKTEFIEDLGNLKLTDEHGYEVMRLYKGSWDALMPVIRKIEDIRLNSSIEDNEVDTLKDRINNRVIQVNLEQTYTEVVGFIKWYNQKEKS